MTEISYNFDKNNNFSFKIISEGFAEIGIIKLKKIIIKIDIEENLIDIFDKEFLVKFSRGGA